MSAIMDSIDNITISKYKDVMKRVAHLYYPNVSESEMNQAINYSIRKRYKEAKIRIENNYTKTQVANRTLLELTEFINSKQPIVTASGVMFARHGDVPNPLIQVIQRFLDKRNEDKKMMFTFPKGSEQFEHYNLLQA